MANISVSPTEGDALTLSVYGSYMERCVLAVLYGLISFVGMVGNGSVLLAVVLSLRPRTPTNVFVVIMSTADLLTCMLLPINVLAILSLSREELLVPGWLCSLQGYVLVVSTGCSLNSIACIAVHRALVTCRGNSRPVLTRYGIAGMASTSLLIPFSLGLIPVLSEYGSYEYDPEYTTCSFSPSSQGAGTFSKITVASFYPVQLIVTFTSYAVILVTVRRHARRVNIQNPLVMESQLHTCDSRGQSTAKECKSGGPAAAAPAAPGSSAIDSVRQSARHNDQISRRNLTVTLNMFLVLFFFIVCVAPYFLAVTFVKDRSQKYIPFLGCLLISNTCVNPVIYIARHPDFKKVCRCILLCRLSQIPRKSPLLRRLLSLRSG